MFFKFDESEIHLYQYFSNFEIVIIILINNAFDIIRLTKMADSL
jgi:hypothetical protein